MEGSRRGKGNRKKGLPTPDQHVDERNGVKPQYTTRRKIKRKGDRKGKRKKKKEKKESKRLKKYNSKKEEFITLSPNTRARPRILFAFVHM